MAHFDLFVVGGGSGGVACARRAASHGAKVGIAEGGRMGGTCVIRGCVPKKLMHYGAHFAEHFRTAQSYGWRGGQQALDFEALLKARNKEIQRLNGIYIKMLQAAGVEIHAGFARLHKGREDGVHAVEINGERHTTAKVVIAVGAKPQLVDVEGIEHAVTSDFMLEQIYPMPRRFAVVGAGYIGVEIASILNGLGAETTIVLRGDEPLRGFDNDLRREMTAGLEGHGVQVRSRTTVSRIVKAGEALRLETSVGAIEADMVLYATGRASKPQTSGIGLEELGVGMNDEGAIYVDATYETNVKGIYAVGDCSDHAGNGLDAGQHDLTPVAIAEGRVIAEALYNNNPHAVRYDTIPTAVFGMPQAGSVGFAEARARDLGHDVAVYKTAFRPMLYSLAGSGPRTMMKLVVDKATDKLLGCHMVGDDAAEIVQGFAVAMTAGATKADLDETVGVHPSAAEELVTMYKAVDEA